MNDPEISDKVFIKTLGSTISKMTFFICCTVAMGMMMSTCQVDESIIVQCKKSCGVPNGMKEVTGTSCECNAPKDISLSPFVL
jgi:hypothetical protein